nr:hypothetical protein [Tanacetum cinerariifolium]
MVGAWSLNLNAEIISCVLDSIPTGCSTRTSKLVRG